MPTNIESENRLYPRDRDLIKISDSISYLLSRTRPGVSFPMSELFKAIGPWFCWPKSTASSPPMELNKIYAVKVAP